MALKKCRECGREVSSEAKTCPSCGIQSPGGKRIGCVAGFLVIGTLVWVLSRVASGPTPAPLPTSPVSPPMVGNEQEKIKEHFLREEKLAKDAVWTSPDMFKVGVINNGTRMDGYAQYVCEAIQETGLKGHGVRVQIIDIARLKQAGKWETIGEAQCL